MPHSTLLFPAAAIVVALGCSEQQPPTAPVADLPAPSYGAAVEHVTGPFPFGTFGYDDGSRTLIFGAPSRTW